MNPMFYFLLALTAVLAETANAGTPILDSDGNPVLGNASYYVRSREGGGLALNPFGVNICPLYVGLERSADNDGIPVKFSDWKSGDEFVPEDEPLNIEMDVKDTLCFEPTYWRISTTPVVPVTSLISTGPKPFTGQFRIRRSERFYRRICGAISGAIIDRNDCTDVGLSVDDLGLSRLALNAPSTFDVEFKKVP
ncbi:unnamed protein product [Eruca vesicaria subsp. sativa]|uniref:Uncharacterized protein n=1 Tax=Eruca vesicaria subsp. sativa TaxID=29727 RepID=A0ABC8IR68_ERUVS|nr:unnamed protein product [Eruca vesicaria subsp. sativa]